MEPLNAVEICTAPPFLPAVVEVMSVFSIAPIEPPDTAMAPPSRVATVLELKKKVYCINRLYRK